MYCVYLFTYRMNAGHSVYTHILYSVYPLWPIMQQTLNNSKVPGSTVGMGDIILSFPEFTFITLFAGFCNKYLPFSSEMRQYYVLRWLC